MGDVAAWAYEMSLDMYVDVLEHMDPRTDEFFLMGSPLYPIIVIGLYLLFVSAGYNNWMKENENNLSLCRYINWYNLFILVLNLVVGSYLSILISNAEYSSLCQQNRFKGGDINEDSLPDWLWYFLMVKIIEFMDTFWIVLKGKRANLTLLHVYHHATIVLVAWIGVRFTPGGLTAIIAKYNCWVQVALCSYFFLTNSIGFDITFLYLKYRQLYPIAEVVQVTALVRIVANGLFNQCGYPNWVLTILSFYMLSYIIMFTVLYAESPPARD